MFIFSFNINLRNRFINTWHSWRFCCTLSLRVFYFPSHSRVLGSSKVKSYLRTWVYCKLACFVRSWSCHTWELCEIPGASGYDTCRNSELSREEKGNRERAVSQGHWLCTLTPSTPVVCLGGLQKAELEEPIRAVEPGGWPDVHVVLLWLSFASGISSLVKGIGGKGYF